MELPHWNARQGEGCRSTLRSVRAPQPAWRRRPRVSDLAHRSQGNDARPVHRLPLRSRRDAWRSPGTASRMTGPVLHWLPDAFARLPWSIRAKLTASLFALVGLLVAIGGVSLMELGNVNRRTEDVVKLQRKIAAYRQIQQDTTAQLYSVSTALLVPEERALESTLRQLNQFGYDLDRLQFVAA